MSEITKADIGAAFLAWFEEVASKYPGGLVSQAQAAKMLGVSRVVMGRLVAAGGVRSEYFPCVPSVSGIKLEPCSSWLKITSWLGIGVESDSRAFPTACYISFDDVKALWMKNQIQKKCSRSWVPLLFGGGE